MDAIIYKDTIKNYITDYEIKIKAIEIFETTYSNFENEN